MRDSMKTNKDLNAYEWMLEQPNPVETKPIQQDYGDLTELNTDKTLLKTVGKDVLEKIAKDSIDLLDSSVAIYEKNGDYAMGIFSSGWCRLMDSASRKRCGNCSNRQALESGKWICHESCWTLSQKALQTGKTVDEKCDGGIHLYAIPICSEDERIGVLSVGYGNPPQDEQTLKELSEHYHISLTDLRHQATAYKKRPPFIEEMAKKRMQTSAELIGLIYKSKKEEQILKETQRNYELAVEATELGTWRWNIQTGESAINEHWAKMIGYEWEELQPFSFEKWQRFIHPEDFNHCMQKLDHNLLTRNERYECHFRMKHKQGHWIWVQDKGKVFERTPDGKPLLMYGTHQDITQKIMDEQHLRQNEEKFRLMFQYSPVGIFSFDKEGVLLDVNDNFVHIIGSTRKALIGLNMLNLPDKKLVAAVNKAINGQRGYFDDVYHAVTSDRKVQVRGVFNAITDDDGRFVTGIGIIEDISEQKKAENAIIKAKEEAQAANRAKSDFLASMSHEIRTPITGVIGFSDLLNSTPLNDTQKEYNDIVRQSANSLLGIINDILDFSKIEAGKFELQYEKTNLYETIDSALNLLNYKALEKGIELMQSGSRNIPEFVYTDPIRLRQILLNLLSNAVKFTEKGEVELIVKKLEEDAEKKTIRLYFAVKDTGIGIKEEHIHKILEPFNQGDNINANKFEGTGLGLAITKSLLEKMGSQLAIESTFGKGSTFSFELQLNYHDAKPKEVPIVGEKTQTDEKATHSDTARKTILIVEDNKINMQYLETVLKAENKTVNVINAIDGEQALTLFEQHHPDLILMDIQLPKMNGYEVTKRIRSTDREVAIIAITARALKGEREKCLAVGMNDYQPKPVSISTIKAVLKKYL